MRKIVKLTESDLIRIIKKVINEAEPPTYSYENPIPPEVAGVGKTEPLPVKLDLTRIPYTDLSIAQPSNITIQNNQNLLNQLQSKNLIDISKLKYSVNDKDFMSRISHDLKSAGFTPYLKVKRDKTGATALPGFKFSIPQIGLEIQLDKNYFGASETLPFMKNVQFTGYHKPESKSDKFGVGLKIKI